MATTYQGWVKDGRPWKPAECIDSFARTLRGYGYTVYVLGDEDHLRADTPEDHTPFSHTPWPGPQPYPYVDACDIMPGGKWSLADLGARIYADKQAGVSGTEFIKYMNWTDHNGNCWHDSWEGSHQRRSSSDRGHIHISSRTDYVHKPTSYVPFQEDLPVDQSTFNKLMDGWANTTNGQRAIGDAVMNAQVGSKAVPHRTVRQGLGDLFNQLRPALVMPPTADENKTSGMPANAPILDLLKVPARLDKLEADVEALKPAS